MLDYYSSHLISVMLYCLVGPYPFLKLLIRSGLPYPGFTSYIGYNFGGFDNSLSIKIMP